MAKKNCNHGGKYKDEEEFNWKFKVLGVRHKTCRDCMHGFNKKYFEGSAKERHLKQVRERKEVARDVAREYAYQYLSNHHCIQCGEGDVRVLEFHHRDRNEKDMDVGYMISAGYSVQRIQAEINKCDVLCANCHRKITVEERGWFRGRK
jgi:hypothetical protein